MASVQYLTTFVSSVVEELKDQQRVLYIVTKFRSVCAVILQKYWRGYSSRKNYLRLKHAVSTIHRYFLGWKVRKNRKVYEEMRNKSRAENKCNSAAIKIQAWWRGTMARKQMKGKLPKDRIKERQMIYEESMKMRYLLRKQYKKQEMDSAEENRQLLAFVLFKCHHLIRTKIQEGIYSIHNSEKLSFIEQMMKAVPLTSYMKKLRKCYEEEVKSKSEIEYQYLSSSKRLRHFEDLIRHRDKSRDIKEMPYISDKNIHKSQFKFTPLVPSKPYERELLCIGKYSKLDIKKKDKNLKPFSANHKVDVTDKNIPYYIDFWIKECDLHDVTILD